MVRYGLVTQGQHRCGHSKGAQVRKEGTSERKWIRGVTVPTDVESPQPPCLQKCAHLQASDATMHSFPECRERLVLGYQIKRIGKPWWICLVWAMPCLSSGLTAWRGSGANAGLAPSAVQ